MLVIEVAKIPHEGMAIAAPLDPAEMHVEGERSFALRPGAQVDCRIERAEDLSVHVRGHLRAALELECGRCLESYTLPLDQELELFYLPHRPEDRDESEDEVELSDRDMVVAYYEGERLDLGEVLREQLFLAVPLRPLCREDCRGLCAACGANRNVVSCACTPEMPADPRLAVLGRLIQKGSA
jgi:uncharacterized protein